MKRTIAGAALALITLAGEAEEAVGLPSFTLLSSLTEHSALSMDCDGSAPYNAIRCQFTQVSLSQLSAEALAKQTSDITTAAATLAPDEIAKQRGTWCQALARPSPAPLPERSAYVERFFGRIKIACACTDAPCFRSKIGEALIADLRKCSIWTNSFSADLKRVGAERKWLGVTEPVGLCSSVTSTVVESDEKGLLWKFTQVRLSADRTGPFCKDLSINEPVVYAWDAGGPALLDCALIDFGRGF